MVVANAISAFSLSVAKPQIGGCGHPVKYQANEENYTFSPAVHFFCITLLTESVYS